MSTTRPFTGERRSRPVPLAADEYASCRFRFGSCCCVGIISPGWVSRAALSDICAGVDEPDDGFSFASCDFDTPLACRGLDTISEAARPNDPAVSKEADKTAVTGSHLFGSMMKGFGRNLLLSVSTYTSKSVLKDLRREIGWFQYRCFDEGACCSF